MRNLDVGSQLLIGKCLRFEPSRIGLRLRHHLVPHHHGEDVILTV